MLTYENELWTAGRAHVAGVDEVGRGCLFGDVVAAAVVLPAGCSLEGVDDSKKLTEKQREALLPLIEERAIAIGVGRVDAETVDAINIRQASRLAMKKAVRALGLTPDHLLVDAESVDVDVPQTAIIHGDALSLSIAAASVVAKVTRDRLCREWDALYPEYGIAGHKGYATKLHRERLLAFGASPMHRQSFLGKLFAERMEQLELF
ncbi:ribonuclease HII [Paenibacillus antri]|uniref:Ribonuclease HII n=1 Tax=Paenibacillus antri TaxID=2582848 RepID=A0A5R9G0M3_9BACL|nr:ribonuclease HII [Paenibacillus antri]TLS49867.1 ribonuclease HII [Paenibacillus antri]